MSAENLKSIVAEIFQSGTKWWTNYWTDSLPASMAKTEQFNHIKPNKLVLTLIMNVQ